MADVPELTTGMLRGLNTAELDACHALLTRIAPDTGVDMADIFLKVRKGQTLVQAMGLPDKTLDMLYSQAIGRFNAGDSKTATPLFTALTMLKPQERDYWLGLGICGRINGNLPLAKVVFETAVNVSPDTPAPRFHLCELLCQEKNWRAAAEHIQVFDAMPDTPEKRTLAPEMKRLRTVVEVKTG